MKRFKWIILASLAILLITGGSLALHATKKPRADVQQSDSQTTTITTPAGFNAPITPDPQSPEPGTETSPGTGTAPTDPPAQPPATDPIPAAAQPPTRTISQPTSGGGGSLTFDDGSGTGQ